MIILGIETSCDETALALLECEGGATAPRFNIIAESVYSQIKIHEPFGGVFPMLAKREHSENLIPLFASLLEKAGMKTEPRDTTTTWSNEQEKTVRTILDREPKLLEQFLKFIPSIKRPTIDAIAVTYGPGLEPALWVGINFAKALGTVWNIPVIPTNHMEGHIFSVLMTPGTRAEDIRFPVVALLVSGGHTELVLVKDWLLYELIGETRDDAVGEAFDKVARILGLPYPGGPQISALAELSRHNPKETPEGTEKIKLPRPMINSGDYDFSFSGLKTSVLYLVKKLPPLTDTMKQTIAKEFEDAAVEVLVEKTRRAIQEYGAKTLIVGGGVVANKHLRSSFEALVKSLPDTVLLVPELSHSTDNAVMIAAAAYFRSLRGRGLQGLETDTVTAKGTLSLHRDNA